MVFLLSRFRRYLQKKFPLPQPKIMQPKQYSDIRKPKDDKKYIPCIGGNKHTPVIAKEKKDVHHIKIVHGAFAIWFKTIIACSVCQQAIEWEKQLVMPHYWEQINLEEAEKVKADEDGTNGK